MPNRKLVVSTAVAALLVAASVSAQSEIATLSGVQGTVLVSKGEGMTAATNGQPIADGSRVVVTGQSRAVIKYASGCEVSMPENSRATVQKQGSCAALQALVVLLPAAGAIGGTAGAGAVAGAATIGPVATGALVVVGTAVGYGAYKSFIQNRDDSAVSGQ
jgi:hypothetical protein